MKKIITSFLLSAFTLLAIISSANLSFAQIQTDNSDSSGDSIDCTTLNYSLKLGSRDFNTNGDVSKLQTFLSQANYLDSDPTGYFGRSTKKAVQDFQRANSISPTGSVGAYTRAKIKEVSCGGVTTLPPNPSTASSITYFKIGNDGGESSTIILGNSTNLFWEAKGVLGCSISTFKFPLDSYSARVTLNDSLPKSGGYLVKPIGSTLYLLTCNGTDGVNREGKVLVKVLGSQDSKIISSFIQDEQSLVNGDIKATFKYAVDNYKSGLILEVQPVLSCSRSNKNTNKDCLKYFIDIKGDIENYLNVEIYPNSQIWSEKAKMMAFSKEKGTINFRVKGDTSGRALSDTVNPDYIQLFFTLRDLNQGGKELWSKSEYVRWPSSDTKLPVISYFNASSKSINKGESVTFSWSAEKNVSRCDIQKLESNGGRSSVAGNVGTASTYKVFPEVATKYILYCIGFTDGSGKDAASVEQALYISVEPTTTHQPSITSFNTEVGKTEHTITSGLSDLLSWTSVNSTSCTLFSSVSNSVKSQVASNLPPNGTYRVTPQSTTLYILVCSSTEVPNLTIQEKRVTVYVSDAPSPLTATGDISLTGPSKCSIPLGASSCSIGIRWTTNNAVSSYVIKKGGTSAYLTGTSGSNYVGGIFYGEQTLELRGTAGDGKDVILDTQIVGAECVAGATWNGSVCASTPVTSASATIDDNSLSFSVNENGRDVFGTVSTERVYISILNDKNIAVITKYSTLVSSSHQWRRTFLPSELQLVDGTYTVVVYDGYSELARKNFNIMNATLARVAIDNDSGQGNYSATTGMNTVNIFGPATGISKLYFSIINNQNGAIVYHPNGLPYTQVLNGQFKKIFTFNEFYVADGSYTFIVHSSEYELTKNELARKTISITSKPPLLWCDTANGFFMGSLTTGQTCMKYCPNGSYVIQPNNCAVIVPPVCKSGEILSTNGLTCLPDTGTGSVSATSCAIKTATSTCLATISFTTSGAQGGLIKVSTRDSITNEKKIQYEGAYSAGTKAIFVPVGTVEQSVLLYVNDALAAQTQVKGSCEAGSTWNGSVCYANTAVAKPTISQIAISGAACNQFGCTITLKESAPLHAEWSTNNIGNGAVMNYSVRVDGVEINKGSAYYYLGTPKGFGLSVGRHTIATKPCNQAGCAEWSPDTIVTVTQ